MDQDGQAFGELLRAHRQRALLTQEQLARRSGMSTRTIRELERGRVHRPRAQSVQLLAEALGLDDQACKEFQASVQQPDQTEAMGSLSGSARGDDADAPPAVGQWTAPFLLPPDIADFTGRDEVLGWLLRTLGLLGGAIPVGLPERAALYPDAAGRAAGAGGAGQRRRGGPGPPAAAWQP